MLTGIELLDRVTGSVCLCCSDETSDYHHFRRPGKRIRVVGDIRIERMTFCL